MGAKLLLACLPLMLGSDPAGGELVLAEHGRSGYVVVVAAEAAPATRHAADELVRWLKEITGVELAVVSEAEAPRKREILVGPSQRLKRLDVRLDPAELGQEGYLLRTVGERLVVAGTDPRGTLHAVHGLLEEHLGCRWFTPEVSVIPRRERLVLPALDETRRPAFEYRDVFIRECFDGDWALRNRLNSSHAGLDAARGGRVEYQGFVHTFDELVPPARYFATHPEYFAEVGGRRLGEGSQLCCTNAEVVGIVTEEIRRRMRAHPEAKVFSVSQNDRFNDCQCGECRALSQREGSAVAPVLQLVNQVAAAIADEFPDKLVDTLAYQWSRHPPRTMRARENVIVRLCSIECCFAHPLADCPQNAAFVADVVGWSQKCARLWVWDYVTDFAHYLLPFPNHGVLAANVRFFAAHGVTGIFEEGNYTSPLGEFQALRGYVLAKLLWNPAADERVARDEFLAAVYGPAAEPLRRYLELLPFPAPRPEIHAGIFDGVRAAWLGELWQESADELFDAAEEAVAKETTFLTRVRAARLAVDYVALERARGAGATTPELAARVRRFFDTARAAGLTAVSEGSTDLAAYQRELEAALGMSAAK